MTIKEAGFLLKSSLLGYYDHREASAISDMVLEDMTGFNRVDRILHDRNGLSADVETRLKCSIKYLQQKMPVQYVLGYAYFAGLKLKVNNQVLIPRPETEELVDWVIETLNADGESIAGKRVLDMGTGSGCIPLAIKSALPQARVSGCDISDGALGVARHNSRLLNLKVDFFKLDILEDSAADNLPILDCIISNPPYIHHDEKLEMEAHVLDYEPHLALFPEKDVSATIFYQKISQLARKKLRAGGWLFLEINPIYVKEIFQMLKQSGADLIEFRNDLQGKERMVKCLFKS